MIAIEVELLTGRYAASSFSDRNAPEWPPHPARLFSALVATAEEQEETAKPAREALEWLERQGPPHVLASEAQARAVVTVYVPENTTRVLSGWAGPEAKLEQARTVLAEAEQGSDLKAVPRARKALMAAERTLSEQIAGAVADDGKHNASSCAQGREMLPERRGKQPRTFPSVTPEQPRVRYLWPDAAPDATTHQALSQLSQRMVRLGHSSSLVACRVVQTEAEAATNADAPLMHHWEPVNEGDVRMRTVGHGQVASLERAFERHQGVNPRVLPAVHQSYRKVGHSAAPEPARSVFGEWIVFREIARDGARRVGLRLQRTEDITRALRGALLHHADDPPPAILSGHAPDGQPLGRPHVAFVALADIASTHSSGSVLGVAVLLPSVVDAEERRAILRAVGRWEEAGLQLTLGRIGAFTLERVVERDPRTTLDPGSWTRPSRRWASVTPVALDENPGDLFSRDPGEVTRAAERAADIVARSCERIGLPRPRWTEIARRSLFDAAPAARDFMPFPRKPGKNGAYRRVCVHVEMCFDEPVAGPVLIGAGRYFGLGLCGARREGW